MNDLLHIPSQNETALQRFLELRIIQLLFMGLSYVLGRSWTPGEKAAFRDQAYRVRGAVQAATLAIETRRSNANVLTRWSEDASISWQSKMARVWNCVQSRIGAFITPAYDRIRCAAMDTPHPRPPLNKSLYPP